MPDSKNQQIINQFFISINCNKGGNTIASSLNKFSINKLESPFPAEVNILAGV